MSAFIFPFSTKHQTAPFSQIKLADYLPAFQENIQKAKEDIDAITQNPDAPTFENTIEALDYAGQELELLSHLFFNLNSAETCDEMQRIAREVSPLLTAFGNDVVLNEELFKRVKQVYEQREALSLTTEQQTLLEKKFKGFARNGALLDEASKEKLRKIDEELGLLSLTFGEHVLAETHAYQLHITNENDLNGLPEGAKEMAKSLAESKGLEGWVFTLDYPSYIPFMTYADNRELRKEMAIAFGRKGFQANEYNNEDIVKKIVRLRHERANLLGYASHAHFVLEERMAQTPEQVQQFLYELLEKAKPAAEKEFEELTAFAKATDGVNQLEKWDGAYYTEKLKQQRFDLDDEALKPYFQLEKVMQGAFTIAEKLFGITFREVFDIDTYHKDVQTFEVLVPTLRDEGKLVAVFYADFFPRKGKRNGAWMTSFKPQYIKDGVNERPHVSIVCNFTPPTPTKPSLLTFNEVTTLFHEFGHALHGMLANTTYPSLSGTSVYWDFVELPSQIMENWCYEPEALALFAKHYQTGEVIPQNLVDKIKESANFMEGMATLRQLSFGLLDMAYHAQVIDIHDIKSFEKQVMEEASLYPDVAENCMSTSFSHIFQGGYSSGYYSYKWAEVLDADAFAYFQEEGIFNWDVAQKFKEYILSKGGTELPMELYKKFRGQEPNVEALLVRAGLVK